MHQCALRHAALPTHLRLWRQLAGAGAPPARNGAGRRSVHACSSSIIIGGRRSLEGECRNHHNGPSIAADVTPYTNTHSGVIHQSLLRAQHSQRLQCICGAGQAGRQTGRQSAASQMGQFGMQAGRGAIQ